MCWYYWGKIDVGHTGDLKSYYQNSEDKGDYSQLLRSLKPVQNWLTASDRSGSWNLSVATDGPS